MHRKDARLVAILGGILLIAGVGRAQDTAPRGMTKLDSGSLRLLHGSDAYYPDSARVAGIEGTVVVDATLDAKGHVLDAQVISGPVELRASALRSVLDDHFAFDKELPRKAQLRLNFTLDKSPRGSMARIGGPGVYIPNPPVPISTIECPMLTADLCRDARQRISAEIGNPLTPEKHAQIQKEVEEVDDHLWIGTRKTPQGVALPVYLRYPGGPDPSIVGGIMSSSLMAPSIVPPPPPPPAQERKPDAPGRISVGRAVMEAKLTRRVSPVYPQEAKSARIQGAVRLSAIIGKDGSVTSVTPISGNQLLIPAAVDAVKQWQYQPTLLNGQAVEVATEITVTFTLGQ